ncbi:MAG: VTT domain-containing protein [Dehalococcoidia bacterium]|nr:VTT domain-containing protein [Dehalococcoidia bacterium]
MLLGVDLETLIETIGYVGLFAIVFAETGLLVGFFLPGDTLLITTGLVAQRGVLDIRILIPLLIVAAVSGDATGYQIGKHTGPRIFNRDDSRLFHRKHIERAKGFYDRHGGKTIVLARFLAIVRTFAPTVAGAAQMPYLRFAMFNVIGGVAWITSMLLTGYFVGEAVPNLEVASSSLCRYFPGHGTCGARGRRRAQREPSPRMRALSKGTRWRSPGGPWACTHEGTQSISMEATDWMRAGLSPRRRR